jgi:hypothetical protein
MKTLSENSKREYTIEDIRNKNLTTYLWVEYFKNDNKDMAQHSLVCTLLGIPVPCDLVENNKLAPLHEEEWQEVQHRHAIVLCTEHHCIPLFIWGHRIKFH